MGRLRPVWDASRKGILRTPRSADSSRNRVRRHLMRNAEPLAQSSGAQCQFSRKTSCNRVLERFIFSQMILGTPIAVGMPIAEHPRTDPGERDSRTGLPPWVINGEAHKQLLVHDQASGTRFPGSVSGTCVALPCSPWSSSLAPPAPPPVAQVCSPASTLL
jgi:hypothetical protein